MKLLHRLSFVLGILIVVGLSGCVGNNGDVVVFGESYRNEDGNVVNGSLAIFADVYDLEEDTTVNGGVILFGGTLIVHGKVNGDITSIGGDHIHLTDTAIVTGDVVAIATEVTRDSTAVVTGSVVEIMPGAFAFDSFPFVFQPLFPRPHILRDSGFIANAAGDIFKALLLTAVSALVVLLVPVPTTRVAESIVSNPVIAGSVGLLTVFVFPLLSLLLAVTLILIPLIPLLIFLLAISLFFGWIALGLETGDRIAALFSARWEKPVSAAAGVLVLTMVVIAADWISTCCIGGPLVFILAIVGLGGVVVTRFGTSKFDASIRAELPSEKPTGESQATPEEKEEPERKGKEDERPSVGRGDTEADSTITSSEEEPAASPKKRVRRTGRKKEVESSQPAADNDQEKDTDSSGSSAAGGESSKEKPAPKPRRRRRTPRKKSEEP